MMIDDGPRNEPLPAAGARPLSAQERGVVEAARRWYELLVRSGGDLDQPTLCYVFGTQAGRATLELLDACFDAEHQRARPAS